tara:strand:+ start:479 stop:952 length:474 start_codon:yes stop_codon:yes gene_type:complete
VKELFDTSSLTEDNPHLADPASVEASTAKTSAAALTRMRKDLEGSVAILTVCHKYLEALQQRTAVLEAMLKERHSIQKGDQFFAAEIKRAKAVDPFITALRERKDQLLADKDKELISLAWKTISTQAAADRKPRERADWIEACKTLVSLLQGTQHTS